VSFFTYGAVVVYFIVHHLFANTKVNKMLRLSFRWHGERWISYII